MSPIVSGGSGGGSGASTQIFDTALSGIAATIDWTPIPATYNHLLLEFYGRSDTAATSTSLLMRFNNDSGAKYDYQRHTGAAGVAGAAEGLGQTSIELCIGLTGNTAPANVFSMVEAIIPNYANAANQKNGHARGTYKIGVASGNIVVDGRGFYFRDVSAITRITLLPGAGNFMAGTHATLYGLT